MIRGNRLYCAAIFFFMLIVDTKLLPWLWLTPATQR